MRDYYDAFEDLCADSFDHRSEGLVALIRVYFDATHTAAQPRWNCPEIYTVGACMSTREGWRKFRKEWRAELDKKGLEYFHLTDFEYAFSKVRRGEPLPSKHRCFDWPESEFLPFIKRLQRTLVRKSHDRCRLQGFASSIVVPDYDSTIPDELKNDPRCRSHYIFNVNCLIGDVARWAKRNKVTMPIHYVFASGDGEGGNLERLFTDIWRDPISRKFYQLNKSYSHMPFYDIADMSDEPAIQAADIYAYELHKNTQRAVGKSYPDFMPPDESRKSLIALAKCRPSGMVHRKEELGPAFEHIMKHNDDRATGKGIYERND